MNDLLIITILSIFALVFWVISDNQNPSKFDSKTYWKSKENKWKGKH